VDQHLTSGSTGQISAVTFCAKTRTKAAIKNLLGEPGVIGLMPEIDSIYSFLSEQLGVPLDKFSETSDIFQELVWLAMTALSW